MKKQSNELLQFLAGLGMLAVGLYFFMQKVQVTSTWFSGGGLFGVSWLSNGLVVVPFIIGIIWVFVDFDSFPAKLLTGLGLLIIIASVIASTRLHLNTVSLYEWLLMLVLIFGGGGMVLRILFKDPDRHREKGKKKGDED